MSFCFVLGFPTSPLSVFFSTHESVFSEKFPFYPCSKMCFHVFAPKCISIPKKWYVTDHIKSHSPKHFAGTGVVRVLSIRKLFAEILTAVTQEGQS